MWESIIADSGDGVGDGNGSQPSATIESIVADGRNGISIAVISHSVRNGEGTCWIRDIVWITTILWHYRDITTVDFIVQRLSAGSNG